MPVTGLRYILKLWGNYWEIMGRIFRYMLIYEKPYNINFLKNDIF
jgi:hypothetical protein